MAFSGENIVQPCRERDGSGVKIDPARSSIAELRRDWASLGGRFLPTSQIDNDFEGFVT
jgi:hypothetical protein